MTVIEELQTAVNSLDTLTELAAVFGCPSEIISFARHARANVLRALDDIEGIPATVCVDNHTVQRMIDAAGVEYRRSVFM